MLQIKNTLGGGKPEGLYAWKKYSTLDVFVEKYISTTEQKKNIFPYSSSNVLYKSSSYTFDKNTGIYTLVNPTSVSGSILQDAVHMYNGEYFMLNANSGATMYKAPTSASQESGVTASNSAYNGFSIQTYGNYGRAPYYIYSNKSGTERTFISCIVANDESAYPNGAVHTDGYYYERVSEEFTSGELTLASSVSTITIEHGLGKIPTWFVLASESKPTAQSVPIQMYFAPWVGATVRYYDSNDSFSFYQNQSTYITAIDENSITLKGWTSFTQSIPLHWIAI